MQFRRDFFAGLALFLALLTLAALALFPVVEGRILQPLGLTTDHGQSAIALIGAGLIFGCVLLSWRNDVGLSFSQPQKNIQSEDYAITKAKTLWGKKQPREAVQVLIARINELNNEQPQESEPARRYSLEVYRFRRARYIYSCGTYSPDLGK